MKSGDENNVKKEVTEDMKEKQNDSKESDEMHSEEIFKAWKYRNAKMSLKMVSKNKEIDNFSDKNTKY